MVKIKERVRPDGWWGGKHRRKAMIRRYGIDGDGALLGLALGDDLQGGVIMVVGGPWRYRLEALKLIEGFLGIDVRAVSGRGSREDDLRTERFKIMGKGKAKNVTDTWIDLLDFLGEEGWSAESTVSFRRLMD